MIQVRVGKSREVAGIRITPIERICISADVVYDHVLVYVACEPVVIILQKGEHRWAVSIDGEAVGPEQLAAFDPEVSAP